MRNNTILLVLILLLVGLAIYIVLPFGQPTWLVRSQTENATATTPLDLRLGLDLRGGTQVLLEAIPAPGQTVDDGAMESAKTIIDQRVNGLGVTEANVQRQGENRIIVELPGVSDPDQAINTVRSTGQLEFVDPGDANLSEGMIINTTNRPDGVQRAQAGVEAGTIDPAMVAYPDRTFQTAMTGDVLAGAAATADSLGQPQISFETTSAGSDQFLAFTSANIGRPMAIVLDGKVLSAPVIQAAISDQGVITGRFTADEAESLAVQLRYGALPVQLDVANVRTVGASLGSDSIAQSLRAGLVGLVAVFAFLLLMYGSAGLVAAAALVCFIFFTLAVYKVIPVTLTLPGVAGFFLSIGMAVDANILIFERMKEELRSGRSPALAIEAGFSRAWPAIIDSQLSAIISAFVLIWFGRTFGASPVLGFAVNLALGVAISLFSSYFVTRTFIRALPPSFVTASFKNLMHPAARAAGAAD